MNWIDGGTVVLKKKLFSETKLRCGRRVIIQLGGN